jgi:TRAP-type C4-dicarboxylate transport system permease small subunit
MASPLGAQAKRFDDGFERFDAQLYRLESGVITFALLAMSLPYFLKIVYEAVIAQRNFIDNFLLRMMHSGEGQAPSKLVNQVHGELTPLLVAIGLTAISLGVARALDGHRHRALGHDESTAAPWTVTTALMTCAIAAGLVLFGWLVVNTPSYIACALLYLVALTLFGRRAWSRGQIVSYIIAWTLLSLPIIALISRIPEQYAWVYDLCKILIMYIGFIGASMASREQKHIALKFGRKLWPRGGQRALEVLSLSVWLAFDLLLLVLAGHLFEVQWSSGSTLPILPIAEYHITLPVVLSFALMSMRVAADLVRVVMGRTPLAHDDGEARA